jgi:hypothetical protein
MGAQGIDSPDHLMAGHSWILNAAPGTIFGETVAVADLASLDLDPDLARSGLGNVPLNQFQRAVRSRHLDNPHLGHYEPRGN